MILRKNSIYTLTVLINPSLNGAGSVCLYVCYIMLVVVHVNDLGCTKRCFEGDLHAVCLCVSGTETHITEMRTHTHSILMFSSYCLKNDAQK